MAMLPRKKGQVMKGQWRPHGDTITLLMIFLALLTTGPSSATSIP